jgi:hypothetical protein
MTQTLDAHMNKRKKKKKKKAPVIGTSRMFWTVYKEDELQNPRERDLKSL